MDGLKGGNTIFYLIYASAPRLDFLQLEVRP